MRCLLPILSVLLLFSCEAEERLSSLDGWELTFSDDFDGEKLDYEKWTPRDPWGVERNRELQGYWIKAFLPEDGILKIRCEARPSFYDGKKRDYRSGMMSTSRKFSQTYGRFEIRCKVPKGAGLWPAFWMLPDPPSWPPEIDVLEILCQEPDRVYMTNHWPRTDDPQESDSVTGEFRGPDFSAAFHCFTVEWEENEIRWYVDGILRHRSRDHVPQVSMFLLVNLAVGGWAEEPGENTAFPADFEIDYVKAWEKTEK
ncbi:MAG: glycoside hydrolase family 16 protein [Verrucomicrobiales bacterium]|nr:glycoside hydrolase family 16 protein [Verrucomicrobiales bacterium]